MGGEKAWPAALGCLTLVTARACDDGGPALWVHKHVLCPSEQRHRTSVLAELVSDFVFSSSITGKRLQLRALKLRFLRMKT